MNRIANPIPPLPLPGQPALVTLPRDEALAILAQLKREADEA